MHNAEPVQMNSSEIMAAPLSVISVSRVNLDENGSAVRV
jgi:hypothetical protein